MRGTDDPAQVRPVPVARPNILIPALVGLAAVAAGGFVIQDSCARLLDAVLVRAAVVARLAFGVALLAAGGAVLGLYVPTARLKANVSRLHPLRGRSREQIVSVLGRPRDVQNGPDKKRVRLTWRTLVYRITAEFHGDKCVGVKYHRD